MNRHLGYLASLFLFSCLAFSGSRMAWIYFILFWVIVFIQPKVRANVMLGSVIFILIRSFEMAGPSIHSGAIERIASGQDHRILMWKHALLMIWQHPFNGIGWGEFSYNMYLNSTLIPVGFLDRNAHNIFLHLGAELGITGLAIFGFLLWVIKETVDWKDTNILIAGVLSIQALHSLVEFPMHYTYLLGLTGLMIGLKQKRSE